MWGVAFGGFGSAVGQFSFRWQQRNGGYLAPRLDLSAPTRRQFVDGTLLKSVTGHFTPSLEVSARAEASTDWRLSPLQYRLLSDLSNI